MLASPHFLSHTFTRSHPQPFRLEFFFCTRTMRNSRSCSTSDRPDEQRQLKGWKMLAALGQGVELPRRQSEKFRIERKGQPPQKNRTKHVSLIAVMKLQMLQAKASSVFNDCLQVAHCRMKASAAVVRRDTLRRCPSEALDAWPYRILSPLLWLPFSQASPRPMRLNLTSKRAGDSCPHKELALIRVSRNRAAATERAPIQTVPVPENSKKAYEMFRSAVTEAKLAEAETLAAWRSVKSLQAVLERPSSGQSRKRVGRGRVATVRRPDTAPSRLSRERAALQQKITSLRSSLLDVEQQNRRLFDEIRRREQRGKTAPARLPQVSPSSPSRDGTVRAPRSRSKTSSNEDARATPKGDAAKNKSPSVPVALPVITETSEASTPRSAGEFSFFFLPRQVCFQLASDQSLTHTATSSTC